MRFKYLTDEEKRNKCYKYGLPIISGMVFGIVISYITKSILGFIIGFILGSFVWIMDKRFYEEVKENG